MVRVALTSGDRTAGIGGTRKRVVLLKTEIVNAMLQAAMRSVIDGAYVGNLC